MARQFLHEVELARGLDPRQRLSRPGRKLGRELRRGVGPVGGLDHRHHPLAHLGTGRADHSGVGHLRMLDQQVLDLLRIDVHPARDDHEALAVGQEQIAVLVQPPDIAQGGPAARVIGGGRLLRVVVIFERVIALEIDVADHARRQFVALVVADVDDAEVGAAHRSRLPQPLFRVDDGHAVALGPSVVLDQDRAEPVDHGPLDRHGAWRRGVDGQLQRRDVVAGADILGQFQHTDEVGRHPLAVGHAVGVDGGQGQFGIEPVHQHHRAAEMLHPHRPAQRRGMIQRRRAEIDAGLVHTEAGLGHHCGHGHGGDVAVLGQFRPNALGPSRGARGIEHLAASHLVGDAGGGLGRDLVLPHPIAGNDAAQREQRQVR
ncbi:hypothetical protein D3C80_1163980 [compost metagenome]